jgi:hypothetical protein
MKKQVASHVSGLAKQLGVTKLLGLLVEPLPRTQSRTRGPVLGLWLLSARRETTRLRAGLLGQLKDQEVGGGVQFILSLGTLSILP